jgi:ATP-binding cassette subfamily F protein uup
VSHDRYFLERVCDDFVALLGDGRVRDLPGGVDEYLGLRRRVEEAPPRTEGSAAPPTAAAVDREAQKAMSRIERQIEKLQQREARLHAQLAEHATDFERVATLHAELREVEAARMGLEEEWLELAT